ncbi:MAG: magnesium transporter CorA family protein [Parcubacteria group bacterium]|nr:magnesium transporter CorA family protein [Parcubacteria group bacterium]
MDRVSSRHVTWTDIENPKDSDIFLLSKKHLIHPLAARELLSVTYRPKLENYDEHLYLVLHFPVLDARSRGILSREIDFVIFPYNLITIHYEDIAQLDEFQEMLAAHEAIRERTFGYSSAHLLYRIISLLFAISRKETEEISGRIKDVEEKVFTGAQDKVLMEIALLRRDLLNFQKSLKPQQSVLESLEEHGKRFFGAEAQPYFTDIKGEYLQVWNTVDNMRETLDTLYETNISLLSANTNEVIKILTIFTVLLMPLSLITFIYSMDIPWIPLRTHPNAFWLILGVMILLSFLMYKYFKQKKWI